MATAIGVSSAYLGGAYDILVQRVVDAWMSFPALVVILSLMAALGPGLTNLILALSLLGAASASRVIRGATLSVIANPYVEAARALGAGHLRIVLLYVLPNVLATILILATIGLGTVILAESGLSFLGFGIPPPYPSWGGMLSGSRARQSPWPSSASTCSATRSATCSTRACADQAACRSEPSRRSRGAAGGWS